MSKKFNQELIKKAKMNQNLQISVSSTKNNTKVVSEDMMNLKVILERTNMATIETTIEIETGFQKVMIKKEENKETKDAKVIVTIFSKIKLIRTQISESTISMITNFTKQ